MLTPAPVEEVVVDPMPTGWAAGIIMVGVMVLVVGFSFSGDKRLRRSGAGG
jgi:hypothetical protein